MTTKKICVGDWVLVTNSPTTGGSYTGTVKKVHCRSWLARQMNGQNCGSYAVVPSEPFYPCKYSTNPVAFILEPPDRVKKLGD